ncbi:MAG: transcription initiation factor IIE alpha subunit [Candidatus Azotimanducaceae bacterium]|jgi:transcription initiation factor IIE alpha subunit
MNSLKKVIMVIAVIAFTSFSLQSCKEKKEEMKEEIKTELPTALYQCPMDCEDGKSYTEAGQCPVCKMDLVEKEVSLEEKKEGHGHDH